MAKSFFLCWVRSFSFMFAKKNIYVGELEREKKNSAHVNIMFNVRHFLVNTLRHLFQLEKRRRRKSFLSFLSCFQSGQAVLVFIWVLNFICSLFFRGLSFISILLFDFLMLKQNEEKCIWSTSWKKKYLTCLWEG